MAILIIAALVYLAFILPWPPARPPKSIREQIERNRWPR